MDNKVFLKEETVVSIADAIREKSGSSEKMTPAQMAVRIQNLTVGGSEDLIDDLNAIHGEEAKSTAEEAITVIEESVDEQAGLISQIQTALQGKTGGSGNNSDSDVNTCTVTITVTGTNKYIQAWATTLYENGTIQAKADIFSRYGSDIPTPIIIENIICGSVIAVITEGVEVLDCNLDGGVERLEQNNALQWSVFKAPLTPNANATIEIYDVD